MTFPAVQGLLLYSTGTVTLHHLNEFIKQVSGVVRSRASLRVVLHRVDGEVSVRETLNGVVVEVDVRDDAAAGQ